MNTLPPVQGESPFESNHADPWARSFTDLPGLNANVTDAIIGAIDQVRTAARNPGAALRTTSILVLGPAGAGKTHLFARLRHKLGPRAVFVLLRPLVGTEMTPRYVLDQIVQQLGYESAEGGMKQLNALVGATLAQVEGAAVTFPRVFIEEVSALDEGRRNERLDVVLERLLERYQEADEAYLARLLATPFMKSAQQRAALAWLSGRELEESQLKRLGVASSLPDERIVQALQTLGVFAACGAPLVLVFDQLENLMDADATGRRVRAYANLVAELFDTLRGCTLVQMALDTEWERAIAPELSTAQKTRLGAHTELISMPTPSQCRELVAKWVEQLPHRAEPFPWPFGQARLDKWSSTPGMTPRMLMIACRRALAEGPESPIEEQAPTVDESPLTQRSHEEDDAPTLDLTWARHVERARVALDETGRDNRSADPARLVGGIALALQLGARLELLRIDARNHVQLVAKAEPRAHSVAILHQMHPKSAATALERAEEALRDSTLLVVRERAIELPPTWKKVKMSVEALRRKGARWLSLERDDAANLLALETFMAAAKSRDIEGTSGRPLEEVAVRRWASETLGVGSWPVVTLLTEESVGEPEPPFATSDVGPKKVTPSDQVDTATVLHTALSVLRIASLERLTREVVRTKHTVTRAEILQALDGMGNGVRWFGRAIVGMKGRTP